MITTTKEEIRKAVMEALEEHKYKLSGIWRVQGEDFPSVADHVAETLGGEG